MATKQFMTLDNLSTYDQLLKSYIGTEDAKSIRSLSVSGNTVSFYHSVDATGTAAYEINLPDTSNFIEKIASATGGKIVTSTATGEVSESATAISDLATNAFVGSIPAGAESTTVVDYIGEAIEDAADDYMPKGDSWDGNKVAITNDDGTVSEGISTDDIAMWSPGGEHQQYIAITDTYGNLSYLDVEYGTYPDDESRTFVYTGYGNTDPTPHNIVMIGDTQQAEDMITDSGVSIDDVSESIAATAGFDGDNTIADAIDALSGYYMPLGHNWSIDRIVVTDSDKTVSESSVDINDLEDSIAATAGFDGDNTIADFIGSIPQGSSATDVIGYVDEQVDAVEDVADEKTVYIVDNGATSAYAKVYSIYQGSAGSAASPVAGEKLIDINIPKDQVVESGSVADITFHDSKLWDGATDVTALIKGTGTPTAADAGKYIKLILQNVTDPLYIAAQSLVDIYTAQPNATSVQLTISNTNEISAVIVDGAVTTAKIADGNVTKAKLAQGVQDSLDLADSAVQSVAEGATNGTVSVDGTDVAVHGLGSAAYTASTAYATSAQGALADTAVQPGDLSGIPQASIEALFS